MKTYFVRYSYTLNYRDIEYSSYLIIDVENSNAQNIFNAIKKEAPNLVQILNITPLN